MKALHIIAWVLVIVGGLNWGLIGAFNFNLVMKIFGGLTNAVYILVGLSAIYELFAHRKNCRVCGTGSM